MSSLIILVIGCPILKQNGRFEKSTAGIPFDSSWLNGSARRGGEDKEESTIGKQKALMIRKNLLFMMRFLGPVYCEPLLCSLCDDAEVGHSPEDRGKGDTKKPSLSDGLA